MPKIAWAKNIYNAYNHVETGDTVYNYNGTLLSKANNYKARCTATSPGSVQLENGKWITGDVEKKNNCWYLTKSCKVS
jgi:hypothetical protein